jgi:outer membrane receptor for ferrienterochelin and colicins
VYICLMRWAGMGLLVTSLLIAQVQGIVRAGGEPVVGARVWWHGSGDGAITDTLGRFTLPEPQAYPAYLRVEGEEDSLVIREKPVGPLEWNLPPRLTLSTQTITGTPPAQTLSSQNVQSVETWSRAALTSAPCCNLSEAFQGSAVVDVSLEGSAMGLRQLRLLGFEPAHSPLLVENKPLSWSVGRPWSAAFLPALWIDHLSLAKGIGSVLNGHDGPAGQIQVFYLPETEEASSAIELFSRTTGEVLGAFRYYDTMGRWRKLWLGQGGGTPWESGFLQDHSGDGFLDVPLYRQGQTHLKLYRRPASGRLVEWEVGGLYDYRRSGQLFISEPAQVARMEGWAAFQTIWQVYASGRRGWVWRKGRGLSLLWHGRLWEQRSYPGLAEYAAKVPSGWVSLIYRQPIGDTRLLWNVGLSAYANDIVERLRDPVRLDSSWRRLEGVPGVASELSWTPSVRWSVVLGVRADWHSYYGWQGVPRLHVRWAYTEGGALRLSAGRAWRVPDPIAENLPFLFSARAWHIEWPSWPPLESAWSSGFFWTQAVSLWGGTFRWQVDGLLSRIYNLSVLDIEDPWQVRLYRGEKPAPYQTLFIEVQYAWQDQLRVSVSYKHQEVWWPLRGELRMRPLLPRDRFTFWVTANPLSRRWQVDLLAAYAGWLRVPSTAAWPEAYQRSTTGGFFWIVTPQLTYRLDQWEVQVAVENLLNYRQPAPVIAAEQPFGPYFDHSLIWGPIMGRMASIMLRYNW